MIRRALFVTAALTTAALVCACYGSGHDGRAHAAAAPQPSDSTALPPAAYVPVRIDSVIPDADSVSRYTRLTEEDFRRVANELQIEVAAIKAVTEIEAGKAMQGFWAPGVPVVNCDRSLWNTVRSKVKSDKKAPENATIPSGLKSTFARNAWQKLVNARKENIEQADLSTFWGMFQIGGFNFKLCGCKSIQEFVGLMSYSELEQLELFAALITNTGQVKYLRTKDWAGFARRYNGASYARRGYHTRMAAAYRKYSKQ